jgi:transposase
MAIGGSLTSCSGMASSERRRRRAIVLLAQGFSLREVARRVQASIGSVSQWRQVWQQGGEAALAPKPPPAHPRRLTDQQCTQLVELLLQGATAPWLR